MDNYITEEITDEIDYDLNDVPSTLESIAAIMNGNFPVVLGEPLTASKTLYSEKISIRIPRYVLEALRAQAATTDTPYQTYINYILSEHTRKL